MTADFDVEVCSEVAGDGNTGGGDTGGGSALQSYLELS